MGLESIVKPFGLFYFTFWVHCWPVYTLCTVGKNSHLGVTLKKFHVWGHPMRQNVELLLISRGNRRQFHVWEDVMSQNLKHSPKINGLRAVLARAVLGRPDPFFWHRNRIFGVVRVGGRNTTADNANRLACQQYESVDGYRQEHASIYIFIYIHIYIYIYVDR